MESAEAEAEAEAAEGYYMNSGGMLVCGAMDGDDVFPPHKRVDVFSPAGHRHTHLLRRLLGSRGLCSLPGRRAGRLI